MQLLVILGNFPNTEVSLLDTPSGDREEETSEIGGIWEMTPLAETHSEQLQIGYDYSGELINMSFELWLELVHR